MTTVGSVEDMHLLSVALLQHSVSTIVDAEAAVGGVALNLLLPIEAIGTALIFGMSLTQTNREAKGNTVG